MWYVMFIKGLIYVYPYNINGLWFTVKKNKIRFQPNFKFFEPSWHQNFKFFEALFASFEGRGRKDLGGEEKRREKGGKTFPLFGI